MELILWRHAEAEEGFPDAARKLTEKGLDQAKRMSEWLKSKLPENTLVLVSPTQRTQQTAMALRPDFVICDEIGPGANVNSILTAANWPNAQGAVVIVGHQPVLGEVVNSLLPVIPPGLSVKKGSVWWIKCHDNNIAEPVLHAVIYPEML
ncbi:phosphohistidine phosphatase SixA [Nitrosomonas sp. Nm166]|uniref:phosphohistidine phosphatase SixA n=1 Tax=Nitrosomonas sp. Nm166 TaxID=1881054 RepID=UPI0008E5A5E6|nr:phosphohistidine phosphatase SixA [Nitrosomonas sp. Nm166]SFE92462.1 phosphohistidine phosphatase [Nitrosomonas sp. Nm166]